MFGGIYYVFGDHFVHGGECVRGRLACSVLLGRMSNAGCGTITNCNCLL
jgi:hypothetical protein